MVSGWISSLIGEGGRDDLALLWPGEQVAKKANRVLSLVVDMEQFGDVYGLANTAAVIDIGLAGIAVGYTMLKLGWKYFLDIIGYAREIGDDEGK